VQRPPLSGPAIITVFVEPRFLRPAGCHGAASRNRDKRSWCFYTTTSRDRSNKMLSNCFEVEEIERSRTASSSLVLNFSPIQFDDREIRVGRLPYGKDGEQVLQQLRDQHNGTHVFRREGGGPDSILAVSTASEAPLIGEPEAIRLSEHLKLAAALIRNALLNRLADLGGTSLGYEPIEVISRKDLLRISCAQGIAPPEWLGLQLLYEVAIRPIFFSGKEPFVAALVKVSTTRMVERTAAELLGDGFCLEGVYVGKRVPRKDPRITPKFELLGCVRSVEGSRLRLTDSRDGIEAVEASEVWPAKDVFADCLSLMFKERAPEINAALECQRAALRQGPAQLDCIRRVLDALRKRQLEMAPGAPFTFGPVLDDSMPVFSRPRNSASASLRIRWSGLENARMARRRSEQIWTIHR
jgi:hypothetical protein